MLRIRKLALFFVTALIATIGNAEGADSQFDFLIGEHDVTLHAWTGSGWTPPRPVNAEWHGQTGLRDNAIYDEWYDPQSGAGVNVRMFDAEENIWKMMWIATGAYQVQDLRAQMQDGVLRMWQIYPERAGWHAEFEMLNKCQWARADFQESTTGEAVPQFRLVATKRDCKA